MLLSDLLHLPHLPDLTRHVPRGRKRKAEAETTPVSSEKKPKKGAKVSSGLSSSEKSLLAINEFSKLSLLVAQAKKADDDEEGVETTFSDYDSAGGNEPLRKAKGKVSVLQVIMIVVI